MPDSVHAPPPPTPIPSDLIESLSESLSGDIELLVNELRTRWRRGDRVRIEALGDLYARIAAQEEQLLDAIYHEILLREEFGEFPLVEEYSVRFPAYRERLERLFDIHSAMEDEWDLEPEASVDVDPLHPSSTDWTETPAGRKRRRRKAAPVEAPPGYELLDELGRGGMAVVFRARQQNLERVVALKMILGGMITSPDVLVRFEQEARTVAQLQHPGIVQIHEVGEHRGLPYLSLEFVAGGTVHDWLRGRPLPPTEAARLIEPLARTVQFAHERGVIHRDLKPANLLLSQRPPDALVDATLAIENSSLSGDNTTTSQFIIKIADFGLARWLGAVDNLTITGQVIGTPSYMAPEQAEGAGDEIAKPALDVYSLGAILYEFLTGHPPFRGATLLDTLAQVKHDEPVSPRRLQPRLPRDLETICLKCLEKSPARRYATAAALADDLARFLKGETITARPVKWPERVWKWMQRSPGMASLTAITVLFALAGLAGIFEGARQARISADQARKDRDRAIILKGVADDERVKADEQRDIAQFEEARAIAAQADAERQRKLADVDKVRAITAQREAEASFRSAMDAVNALSRFGQQLRGEPRQQATSRRIFDESLKFYERFLTAHSEDPQLKFLAATALLEAGNLRADMGEAGKAHELLSRASGLLDELIEQFPVDLNYRRSASRAAQIHGHLNRRRQQFDAAEQNYLAALSHLDVIRQATPQDMSVKVEQSNTILNRCVVLQFKGLVWEAQKEMQESVRIMRDVVAQSPANNYYQSELARSLDDLGKLYWLTLRYDDCERYVRESLTLREQLFERQKAHPAYRTQFARSLSFVGHLESQRGDSPAAEAHLQRAVSLLEPLLADYPEIYEYWAELHTAYVAQLRVAVRQKGLAGMDPEWQKLKAFLERARKQFPEDPYFKDRQAQTAVRYAFVIWDTPTAASLLRSVRDFLPVLPDTPATAIEAPKPLTGEPGSDLND